MAPSVREKRLLSAAALLFLLLLAFLLLRGEPPPAPPPTPATVATPPPPSAAQAAAYPAPAAPADLTGLRLHGLLASGAILGFADGSQRLVPLGRDALPGLNLVRIEQNQAVFTAAAGGEVRLGFDGPAQAGASAAAAAPAAGAAVESPHREESLRYRIGLAPRRVEGYVRGFTVRPGADLPNLARAGIRPGDLILSVNGNVLNEEQLAELAWTIANTPRIEFEVERGGRRIRLAMEGG